MKHMGSFGAVAFILFFIIVGCGGIRIKNVRQTGEVSNVNLNQNIRFMTFNIRAGGGREDPGMSPYYGKEVKSTLDSC